MPFRLSLMPLCGSELVNPWPLWPTLSVGRGGDLIEQVLRGRAHDTGNVAGAGVCAAQ